MTSSSWRLETRSKKLCEKIYTFLSSNHTLFNLSTDMAECWPMENYQKTPQQFLIGLEAAKECVKLRSVLQKDALSISMAYWAVGVHQLSLKRTEEATESFQTAFK